MNLRVGGMGWVTPLGAGLEQVWERLLKGERAQPESLSSPGQEQTFPVFRVPACATAAAAAHPRLRRSSAISRFAVLAGLEALRDAGVEVNPENASRTAVILAVANGGVVYTKRFYNDVVDAGAQAASPLLFPETVFNAPASHLAAILGVTGASYTLVGDGAVGLLAVKMAEDLMSDPALDRCLVVGAEEADWLLCDAYHRWRLLRADAVPMQLFQEHPRGVILSEGAGAIVLDRTGSIELERVDPGSNFEHQHEAAARIATVFEHLGASDDDLIVGSANGTFVDAAERAAVLQCCPGAQLYAPKPALGEAVGAASLWAMICGAQALRTQRVADPLFAFAGGQARVTNTQTDSRSVRRAIVSACGMNQQVAGLSLTLPL